MSDEIFTNKPNPIIEQMKAAAEKPMSCPVCGLTQDGVIANEQDAQHMKPGQDESAAAVTVCRRCGALLELEMSTGDLIVLTKREFRALPTHIQSILIQTSIAITMSRVGIHSEGMEIRGKDSAGQPLSTRITPENSLLRAVSPDEAAKWHAEMLGEEANLDPDAHTPHRGCDGEEQAAFISALFTLAEHNLEYHGGKKAGMGMEEETYFLMNISDDAFNDTSFQDTMMSALATEFQHRGYGLNEQTRRLEKGGK